MPAARLSARALSECFEGAAAASGGSTAVSYQVADSRVRLRFASGPVHDSIAPAIAHLRTDGDEAPELTAHLWDSTSGPHAPPLPAEPGEMAPGAWLTGREDELRWAYQPALRQLSAIDAASGQAWFWMADAQQLPLYERSSPLKLLWEWWLAPPSPWQLVHGAAVGSDGGGVLVVGSGGSGKSTTAVACLLAGLDFAGDDYVIARCEPPYAVASLYATAKLDAAHAQQFAALRDVEPQTASGDGPDTDKAVFFLGEAFDAGMSRGFPLVAAISATIGPAGSETRLVPASRGEVLRALAPSTLLQSPMRDPGALTRMGALVRGLPSYRLELGTHMERLAPMVRELIRSQIEEPARATIP